MTLDVYADLFESDLDTVAATLHQRYSPPTDLATPGEVKPGLG